MPADDEIEGEWVDLDEAPANVVDTPDGGAIVTLGDAKTSGEGEFLANLADDILDDLELSKLATNLLERIDKDREDRAPRDKEYAEGLKRTGLAGEAPGGASFEGASKVVHPMLIEASIDFASRAMKELWPADGPVRIKIEGEETLDKEKRATRKRDLMNWQLTVQAKEARAEVEQALTQVPLGGAQYLKIGWEKQRNRPALLAVMIDDMFLPFAATNFYSAQRKTHRQALTQLEFDQRVASGMYRDIDAAPTSMDPDQSEAAKASDKIEGRTQTGYDKDGLREVYECYALLEIDGDPKADGVSPYIVSIDVPTRKVLSVYRNWEEDDKSREELEWFVELPFLPWRGAYPLGLGQIMGGIAAAATGALRALLDSAHIQNVASGIKLKGGSPAGGQSKTPQPGEIVEVDGGLTTDDIRKTFMPMPFNGPSAVLYELLGFLVDAGHSVVRTALDDVADTQANVPVGTTMARMEQSMVVYSAVHGRLHDAFGRLLQIQHRLNAMYLDDTNIKREVGKDFASRADFTGPMDVVPVSDPNIFSEAQRFAQVQAVAQRADLHPDLYRRHEVERRILTTLRVPDIDSVLQPAQEAEEQNAVNENVAASLGRPIVAFPKQDHTAHLQTHLAYMLNPMLGQSPLIAPLFLPAMVRHLREHIALLAMQAAIDVAEDHSGLDLDETVREHESDAENAALDRLLAQSTALVSRELAQLLGPLQPVLAQLMQQAQQYQQPGPMDPTQASVTVAQLQMQTEQAKMTQKTQADQAKLQQEAQSDQLKALTTQQVEERRAQLQRELAALDTQDALLREQAEDRRTQAEIQSREAMNQADNQTAVELAAFEAATGERVGVSTGTGINPQP